jgi:hypothetical protein
MQKMKEIIKYKCLTTIPMDMLTAIMEGITGNK